MKKIGRDLRTRKDVQAQLADAKAQLFNVQMQRAIAQAQLALTLAVPSFPETSNTSTRKALSHHLAPGLSPNSKVAQTTIFVRSKSFVTVSESAPQRCGLGATDETYPKRGSAALLNF
jgi:hypothetical protein